MPTVDIAKIYGLGLFSIFPYKLLLFPCNSAIPLDPERLPDFVWSAQRQLSPQYRPQSVIFPRRFICNQPDAFSDNCTWPSVSQLDPIDVPTVERRWMSREQPDIHSTAAQWPFSDESNSSSHCRTALSSTVHLNNQNGPGRSTSNSFHDIHPSPFLSSRYHDLYEQARRDLDHLPPGSESGSCSSHGQPLSALTIAYRDLYERARSELDNDPPSDLSDSSNGQHPFSSSQNESRINLESDSRQEHQLFVLGDFPEEEDSSGSDSFPEQAPYCDSGFEDSVPGDHRLEHQGVIPHPHQPAALPQVYRCDMQVLLLEVVQVVPQIQAVPANQNACHVPVTQHRPTDQRNASSQTSQVDLTLTRTAFDCCGTQSAASCSSTDEPSHHTLNSSSTSRKVHEDSTVSNSHFTGNINLRISKDIVPATQEQNISPIIISSDSSPDNSVLSSLDHGVCSQGNNCKYSLSPSGDCSTASSKPDVSTSTSSDSNSIAFVPAPHRACLITMSSQSCQFADDMTKMALSTKVNSDMYGINPDTATSYTPPESILAKGTHTEIEADDEATWDGFPDISRDDRLLRRMSRVRRSRRDRNEIRIINGINRHIVEPCNKLPLSKRKRSLSPSQMDAKRARTDVDGCQLTQTISGHDLQEVSTESARKEANDCCQTQTSGHETGSESDSDRSSQDIQAGPQRPAAPVVQSRKRKRPKGQTDEDDATKKSKREDVAKRPTGTTKRVFHN